MSQELSPACLEVPEQVADGEGIMVSWCPSPAQNKVASYQLVGELKDILLTQSPAELGSDDSGNFTVTRPALPAGKAYCYKVRAVFNDSTTSLYTVTKCTQVGELAFPAPETFFAEPVSEVNANYRFFWSGVSQNNLAPASYQLEQRLDDDSWQPISCNVATVNGYLSCAIELDLAKGGYNGLVQYRLSACTADGVCGNYARAEIMYQSRTNIKTELIGAPVRQ